MYSNIGKEWQQGLEREREAKHIQGFLFSAENVMT